MATVDVKGLNVAFRMISYERCVVVWSCISLLLCVYRMAAEWWWQRDTVDVEVGSVATGYLLW